MANHKSKRLKAIDVKGRKSMFKSYRVVPYPEIEQIIKNGGEAFVEGIDRRTAYSAKKILSKKLGFSVKVQKRIIVTAVDEDTGVTEGFEGYLFLKAE